MRIFEHGESIHRNIFNILYRLKIGCTSEIRFPEQKIVSGRADAILCMDNENYVLDIKSINSMLFRKLEVPKEENVYQVQLYMHFFGIKKGILLYVDKDQQNLKEFFLDYDESLCKGLMDKFYALKAQVEADTLPAKLEDYPRNWQCTYCQYKDVCKLANGGEVKWEDFKKRIETQSI
jgi:CRISPR/Cas system-associated exonuclease Cas4 (RecB family)